MTQKQQQKLQLFNKYDLFWRTYETTTKLEMEQDGHACVIEAET